MMRVRDKQETTKPRPNSEYHGKYIYQLCVERRAFHDCAQSLSSLWYTTH